MNSINVSYGDDTSIIYLYIKYNDGKYQWTMAFKKQENGDYKTTRQLFDNLIIDYLNESGYAFPINVEPKINYPYKINIHKCEFQLTPRALLALI
jgi:hypothetical protein